jgi:exopolysaccharide biosynthesis polyprenyl glycosylphosphotransferase
VISAGRQRLKYVIGDYISSNVAWLGYNCVRYFRGEVQGNFGSFKDFALSGMVVFGQIIFPLVMMAVYYLSGYYSEVFRKSRLQELLTTFWTSIVNSLIIFFIALINDVIDDRGYNYEMILVLWTLLFFLVYFVRVGITTDAARRIKSRKWSFRTLIVGRGSEALAFVSRLERMKNSLGYNVIGFVSIPGENDVKDIDKPCYTLDEMEEVCSREKVEEFVVVPTKQDSANILNAINRLFLLNIPIKITPDMYNILLSRIHINDLYGDPLVDISGSNMTSSEKNIKRVGDVFVSFVLLILLIPVYLVVAILIKLDTHGPVFYTQERVGLHNKPFRIIKFRTMVENAENNSVPQLSDRDDPRVTKVGRFLRKYRIDELPQFFNVLRGDMSLVGPRPERQYYINKILERMPSYSLLHQVRPGITSMGMVKFGYARDVDEMVARLRFDLIYLENMSIINDLKIMVYTVKIVFTGKGV